MMSLGSVVYALLVSGLLGLIAIVGERALRLYGRSTRWVWVLALVASIALPATAILLPATPGPPAQDSGLSIPVVPLEPVLTRLPSPAPQRSMPFERVFLFLWIGASAATAALVLLGRWTLARDRRSWQQRELAGADVLETEGVGPAVIGFLRPVVAVPSWVRDLDATMREMIVAHERQHVEARDPLLLAFALVVCVGVPWNLPLWWQLRRLRLSIEVDCDRRLVRSGVDVRRYGLLLLEVGRRRPRRILFTTALFESPSFLEARIRAMTHRPHHRLVSSIALGLVFLALVGTAIALEPPVAQDRGETISAGPDLAPAPPNEAAAARDTIEFEFTPFTVRPECVSGCDPAAMEAAFAAAAPDSSCDVVVGIRIDNEGEVTGTTLLKRSFQECDEAAEGWARATEWTPAGNETGPITAWFAQPISWKPEVEAAEAGTP